MMSGGTRPWRNPSKNNNIFVVKTWLLERAGFFQRRKVPRRAALSGRVACHRYCSALRNDRCLRKLHPSWPARGRRVPEPVEIAMPHGHMTQVKTDSGGTNNQGQPQVLWILARPRSSDHLHKNVALPHASWLEAFHTMETG